MFGFKSTKEQLLEERRKNAQLQAALEKTSADVEYIAMMTDVELENVKNDVQDLRDRLIIVEQSTKSAHHRIDGLTGQAKED